MYVYYNPNPERNHVGDCVIRALTKALDMSWDDAYITLMVHAYKQKDMPSSNSVWGSLLTSYGYNSYKGEKVWLNIAEKLGMLKDLK